MSGRLFYPGTAVLLLVLTHVGFQWYYLHGKAYSGRDIAPPLQTPILMHATVMTAWIVLFLVQPLLIAKGTTARTWRSDVSAPSWPHAWLFLGCGSGFKQRD